MALSHASQSIARAPVGPRRRDSAIRFWRSGARAMIGCCLAAGRGGLLIVLLAAGSPAAADEPATAEPSLLERYNRLIFSMNGFIYRQIDRIGPKSDVPATELAAGTVPGGSMVNVVGNLVNEPLSGMASAIIGDVSGMKRAVKRFSINSTIGLFGYYDRAAALGWPPEQRDLGLALCARGVPAGPFVMLGLVGPRTLRDAFVDVVIVNLTMYSAAAAVFGTGGGLATIVAVESVEALLDVIATRQIDTRAKALDYTDFAAMRDQYLRQRAERCAALVATMRQQEKP
jgi:phospholipid-binding lipoprotein MlaA